MKIGIITFIDANNYGAIVQAFALQTALRKHGYSPFFPPIALRSEYGVKLKRYIGRTFSMTMKKWVELIRSAKFESFRLKYINRTSNRRMSAHAFLKSPCQAPVYITGSDQVWNGYFSAPHSAERSVFWLNYCENNIKRISYAASFGSSDISEEERIEYTEYIRHFDAISVREESAMRIVGSLGRTAHWVCDPTLLLTFNDYATLLALKGQDRGKGFIYEYALDVPSMFSFADVHSTIAKTKGWRVYSTFPPDFPKNLTISRFDSPRTWLQRIANCKLVVTNSFHCVAMCLVFSKPFVVVPLAGNYFARNERIRSLLKRVSLEDRVLTSCDKEGVINIVDSEIDWQNVHHILEVWRRESSDFLRNAVGVM